MEERVARCFRSADGEEGEGAPTRTRVGARKGEGIGIGIGMGMGMGGREGGDRMDEHER